EIDIAVINTTGDKILDVPLAKIGDKGLFTKELDRALLDGRVDFAVHSLKDVPTRIEAGLVLAAVSMREDPSDALVVAPGLPPSLEELPEAARIGTSSLRRRAQLLARRPDLDVLDLRGNVDTRLAQVAAGRYDAIILALAGLKRLGLGDRVSDVLGGNDWLPAVGQGALAIICRADDSETQRILSILNDDATARATSAERSFLRELEGGCQVPIAARATSSSGEVHLHGLVASLDGKRTLRDECRGPDAEATGRKLAVQLLKRGAADILDEVRAAMEQSPPPAAP
ncbi:MAG TPA: hydroxymethylbilane synthase, partial [Longimicrobiales bacterium]|nr:hydroxymethylbilane synthase [Longimicrobiales bacterium]